MKAIEKTELGNNALAKEVAKGIPQNATEAKSRWGRFPSNKKKQAKRKLLTQQYKLCGYTEFNIDEFSSLASSKNGGCHIEHIKPKSLFPQLTFEYENLIISVLDSDDLKRFKEEFFVNNAPEADDSHKLYFGGHKKENNFDEVLFISPTETDCQRYFVHIEHSGEIKPANGLEEDEVKRAEYTIKLLNLNHPYLKNQRYKRMKEVLDDIEELDDLDDQIYIVRDEISERNGQIASFPSAVRTLVAGA
ncbi:retron system putative HNH endonuclease [Aliivibrio kagoshimensis]|uniref:retron system putative HNH endonuclease n=1 Tax=Aliivibrio kagoshimensis TaxID=2910230 RepID=UPI003D0A2BD8